MSRKKTILRAEQEFTNNEIDKLYKSNPEYVGIKISQVFIIIREDNPDSDFGKSYNLYSFLQVYKDGELENTERELIRKDVNVEVTKKYFILKGYKIY